MIGQDFTLYPTFSGLESAKIVNSMPETEQNNDISG